MIAKGEKSPESAENRSSTEVLWKDRMNVQRPAAEV